EEPVPGRYRLHDLMRAHARALAAGDDRSGNEAASGRLVAYYIRTTGSAVQHIARRSDSTTPAAAPSGESAFPPSPQGALAWLETERPNLAAWFDQAARSRPADVVRLSHAMHPYLRSAGHWDQAVDI